MAGRKEQGRSVASAVRNLIEGNPYLCKAIEDGYCNASAAARYLQEGLPRGMKASPESVRAAVKRFLNGKCVAR